MGEERDAAYYDRVHAALLDRRAGEKPWHGLWMAVAGRIRDSGVTGVVDLGCGTGDLAAILAASGGLDYRGYDFSRVAIEHAAGLGLGERFRFAVADLAERFPDPPVAGEVDRTAYVLTEILEHLPSDISLLRRIPAGAHVIATVPDFDDPAHVRCFASLEEATRRYGGLVDIALAEPVDTGHHFIVAGRRRSEPRVTLAMIARDEEQGIGRAIESASVVAGEAVVLVDTATSDRTEEIARGLGARVLPYEWANDFAAARNLVLDHVRDGWVLWLDGHEYVECDAGGVVGALVAGRDLSGFWTQVEMEDGNRHRHVRLHRAGAARWKNPVHNILDVSGACGELPDLVVIHDRYGGQSIESRARRNAQRDRHIVETLTRRIRDNLRDTRSMFYLGQQHRDARRWEQAYYWYERYGRTEGGNQWPEEALLAAVNAGRAALELADHRAGTACGLRAVEIMPGRAEGWTLIGDVHYALREHARALEAYERAGACAVPGNARLWVDRSVHAGGWRILDKISMCCWHLGDHARGAALCERLLAMVEIPERERARVEDNLSWHRRRLGENE